MEEEIDKLLDPVFKAEYEKEQSERQKVLDAISYVKENIDYPFERIEEYLESSSTTTHIGYVEVESLFERLGVPKYQILNEEKPYPLFDRQDDNDEDTFHCLVYQETIFEDCYRGYLLFPLRDGRYWMVGFEC